MAIDGFSEQHRPQHEHDPVEGRPGDVRVAAQDPMIGEPLPQPAGDLHEGVEDAQGRLVAVGGGAGDVQQRRRLLCHERGHTITQLLLDLQR